MHGCQAGGTRKLAVAVQHRTYRRIWDLSSPPPTPYSVPLKQIEYGVYGDPVTIYPKSYSIYLRGTINISHHVWAAELIQDAQSFCPPRLALTRFEMFSRKADAQMQVRGRSETGIRNTAAGGNLAAPYIPKVLSITLF